MKLRKKILGVITTLTIMVSLVASASAATAPDKIKSYNLSGGNGYLSTNLTTLKYNSSNTRTAISNATCRKTGSRYIYTSAQLLDENLNTLSLDGAVKTAATAGTTASASTTKTSADIKYAYTYSYIKSSANSIDDLDYTIILTLF